jgi:hypothetical protein
MTVSGDDWLGVPRPAIRERLFCVRRFTSDLPATVQRLCLPLDIADVDSAARLDTAFGFDQYFFEAQKISKIRFLSFTLSRAYD